MDLELKRRRIELAVKIVGFMLIGFFVGPFVLVTIKGMIGLVIAFVLSVTILNFMPWFGSKLANWRLKALKNEAAQNPIETLENQLRERQDALIKYRDHIKEFHAEVQNFYSEVEQHEQNFPGQPSKFRPQYNKMVLLLKNRAEKYKQAQVKFAEFEEMIDRKRSEWKVAQAAAKMTKAAGVGEDFLSKLMADTAVDSVQTSLNMAFAELETSLLDEVPQVVTATQTVIPEHAGPPTLDLDLEAVPECDPITSSRSPASRR